MTQVKQSLAIALQMLNKLQNMMMLNPQNQVYQSFFLIYHNYITESVMQWFKEPLTKNQSHNTRAIKLQE